MERSEQGPPDEPNLTLIDVDPLASDEIRDAAAYYECRRVGLGFEFLEEVCRTLGIVSEHPRAYAALRNEVRRANLNRFPYTLLYRIHRDRILVLGCIHGKRGPRIWQSRT